jgi:hypothetical protein
MKWIKILYYRIFRPSIIDKCLQSAYEDLLQMMKDAFTNLSNLGYELSFDELVWLFGRYDWSDIIENLVELEYYSVIDTNKSLFILLMNSMNSAQIEKVESKWDNSYFKEFIIN